MSGTFKIRAYRFVYGKVVQRPGGPVEPGFEHRPTSVSKGMPDWLLPYCRPVEASGPGEQSGTPLDDNCPIYPVQLSSTSPTTLVHPECSQEGALYFSPCSCDGQRYMVATRLRARPEQGDSGLGRTHTQLASFAFAEVDWNQYAPRLLANAGRWLRAEPDLVDFYERGDYPLVEFGPEQLPEVPPCEQGPLPPRGTLLWRLAAAVETKDTNLIVGAADRIDSLPFFLRALACTAALLPSPLRIYLTAAAGLREHQAPFALQYLSDAPALAAKDPGLFEQAAMQLLGQEPGAKQARWQAYWEERTRSDQDLGETMEKLADPSDPGGGTEMRAHIFGVIDRLVAQRSGKDLEAWLDGKRQVPPPRPELRYPKAGTEWIATLTRRLDVVIAGKGAPGAARALLRLATLIDTEGSKETLFSQASYWIEAWRSAVRNAPETHKRAILRWSVLSTSPLIEYHKLQSAVEAAKEVNPLVELSEPLPSKDSLDAELGRLRDFAELGAIAKAIRCAQAESPAAADLVDQAVGSDAFNRRLTNLRAQADQVLVQHPRSLLDLAAAYPALLKPRAGNRESLATSATETLTIETLTIIRIATRRYYWTNESPPKALAGLGEAACTVAQKSFGIPFDDTALQKHFLQDAAGYLRGTLRHYWHWALTPDADRDDPVWPAVVHAILEQCLSSRNLAGTLDLLWHSYQPAYEDARAGPTDETKLAAAAQLLSSRNLVGTLDLLWHSYQPTYEDARAEPIDTTKLAAAATNLSKICLQTLVPPEREPVWIAVDLLQAIPHPVPQAEPSRTFAEALWQRILDAVADERIGAAPHTLEHQLLPVFAATLQRILDVENPKPSPEITLWLLSVFDRLLDTWLEHRIPPRAAVIEILDQLETLTWRTSRTGEGNNIKRTDELLEAIQRLARTLGACLIAWTRIDPPAPWLGSTRELNQSPIHHELAQTLGFPLAAYFGGLMPVGSDPKAKSVKDALGSFSNNRRSELVDYLCQPPRSPEQYKHVIAFGAARCWRALSMKGKQGCSDLEQLMKDKDSRKDNQDSLQAIASLIATAPDWKARIEPETWFTVAFFVSLRETPVPTSQVEFPPTLRKVLLSNGQEYLTSYPIRLGRLIASGNSDLGDQFRQIFKAPEKNRIFAQRVMLLPESGWTGFPSLKSDDKRLRMLRVLFTLSLIIAEEADKTDKTRIRLPSQDILQAMQIPDTGAKDAVARSFDHPTNQEYADAFRAAIGLAGLEKLPGWPDP